MSKAEAKPKKAKQKHSVETYRTDISQHWNELAGKRAEKNAQYTDEHAPLDTRMRVGADRFVGKDGHREHFQVRLPDGSMSEQWLAVPPDGKRCTANIRKGPYQGSRCRKRRLRGAEVCVSHGANLPNVKKNAQMRLLAASDLVAKELVDIALSRKEETPDRIRAANSVLDRAGVDAKQTMTVEVKPWQQSLVDLEAKIISKKAKKKAKAKAGEVIDGKARED